MAIFGISNSYSQQYLNEINDVLKNRMDGNGGKKDGKVTVKEACKDLNAQSLLDGLEVDSKEYNALAKLTKKVPNSLKKYAGQDGVFQAEEWANFLNGKEWGAVLDQYHSSSNYAKLEMNWVDQSNGSIQDGACTKGEVKVGLLNNLQKGETLFARLKQYFVGKKLEKIVDKYAGEDGTFTVEEYTEMLNNKKYKNITEKWNLTPFNLQ